MAVRRFAQIEQARPTIPDSLNLELALKHAQPNSRHWDYLVGTSEPGRVIALEVHPAHGDQVNEVIAKKHAARVATLNAFIEGAAIRRWIWLASGRVAISKNTSEYRRLVASGLDLVAYIGADDSL